MDIAMQKAVDDFVLNRLNDHGVNEPEALQVVYQTLKKCVSQIKESLPESSKCLVTNYENTFILYEGQTMETYYRAGFADAVEFIFGWRDCK